MSHARLRFPSRPVRSSCVQISRALLTYIRTDFLAGQLFDVRVEVHAPVNGTEANGNGTPNPDFELTIARGDEGAVTAAEWFKIAEPELETWNFTWFEGTFVL